MFVRMTNNKDMRYFKSLFLLLFIAGCSLGGSGGGQVPANTPEQKLRKALADKAWASVCVNDNEGHRVTGSYSFIYSATYNTSIETTTYFPIDDTSCSATPSYSISIDSNYFTLGHAASESDTSDELTTSFGLSNKINYSVSAVNMVPYDADGISLAVACGIASPVLNTSYNISACISAGVPSIGNTGYTIMYTNDDVSEMIIEVTGTNYYSPNSRPTDFSVQMPDYMTYTY